MLRDKSHNNTDTRIWIYISSKLKKYATSLFLNTCMRVQFLVLLLYYLSRKSIWNLCLFLYHYVKISIVYIYKNSNLLLNAFYVIIMYFIIGNSIKNTSYITFAQFVIDKNYRCWVYLKSGTIISNWLMMCRCYVLP